MRTDKGVQPGPRTVSLAVKTVNTMLEFLEQHAGEETEELVHLERSCIQAYPRLVNYGRGFDDIIDASGAESNRLSPETDTQMQLLYKEMYGGESTFRRSLPPRHVHV